MCVVLKGKDTTVLGHSPVTPAPDQPLVDLGLPGTPEQAHIPDRASLQLPLHCAPKFRFLLWWGAKLCPIP